VYGHMAGRTELNGHTRAVVRAGGLLYRHARAVVRARGALYRHARAVERARPGSCTGTPGLVRAASGSRPRHASDPHQAKVMNERGFPLFVTNLHKTYQNQITFDYS
jgi:hypothetical protein